MRFYTLQKFRQDGAWLQRSASAAVNTMQESSAQILNAHGVCVVRGSSRGCAACLAEVLAGLDRKLSLPGVMSARPPERHFLPVQMTVASDTQVAAHQRDFKLLFSSCIEAMLRDALSGEAGATLSALLGSDAELQELTAVISEPGAASQAAHSDDTWSAHGAPRRVTLFLALHDIDDEAMGPTRFWPETHAPRCFPGRTSSSTTSSLACLPVICLSPSRRALAAADRGARRAAATLVLVRAERWRRRAHAWIRSPGTVVAPIARGGGERCSPRRLSSPRQAA